MGRALVSAAAVALVLAGPALAGTTTSGVPPVMRGPLTGAPEPRLNESKVTRIFLDDPKVADWLRHYRASARQTTAVYDKHVWTVNVWAGAAGEIATGKVDDTSGAVTEAWTGPQVAWKMARGYKGAFGKELINNPWFLGALCLIFFVGLADFRRVLSIRN